MSDATHNDLTAFTEAYTAFNSALEKLASSQRNLESHFTTLNQQLQDTNGRLQTSLEEESRLNAYLESMLEGLGSGIVAVDTENRVTLVNEAAVDLIGCRPESVLHEPAKALLGEAADLLSLTMSAGDGTTETEQDLTVAGDRTLPVRFKTACLRSRDGTILGARLAVIGRPGGGGLAGPPRGTTLAPRRDQSAFALPAADARASSTKWYATMSSMTAAPR